MLLHGFVDRNSVLRAHFIKLIDADDATVGENHGASLKLKLASGVVLDDCSGETGG